MQTQPRVHGRASTCCHSPKGEPEDHQRKCRKDNETYGLQNSFQRAGHTDLQDERSGDAQVDPRHAWMLSLSAPSLPVIRPQERQAQHKHRNRHRDQRGPSTLPAAEPTPGLSSLSGRIRCARALIGCASFPSLPVPQHPATAPARRRPRTARCNSCRPSLKDCKPGQTPARNGSGPSAGSSAPAPPRPWPHARDLNPLQLELRGLLRRHLLRPQQQRIAAVHLGLVGRVAPVFMEVHLRAGHRLAQRTVHQRAVLAERCGIEAHRLVIARQQVQLAVVGHERTGDLAA